MSRPREILVSQKNAVLNAVEDAGFDKSDFEWSGLGTNSVTYSNIPTLTHKPTGYSFQFDYHEGDFMNPATRIARYSPGRESASAYTPCDSWVDMLAMVGKWLQYILRETKEPDLWSRTDYENFQSWTLPNTKFTPDEQAEVETGLNRVEALLIEHSDRTEKSLKAIKADIKYLKNSSKTSGRRDWLMMFIGTVVSKLSDWGISSIDWKLVAKTLFEGVKSIVDSNINPFK